MRIKLLMPLLLLAVAGSVNAQRGQGFGDLATFLAVETDTLMARLDLADEQTDAVRAILESRADKLMKLRPRPGGGGQAQFQRIRTRRNEIEKETVAALTSLLTEAQMETYHTFMADQQARRRGRARRQRGP